jgi:hypothetical protein
MSEFAPIHRLVLYAALAMVTVPSFDRLESKRSLIFYAGQRHRESAELTPARHRCADPAQDAGVARGLGLGG